MMGIRSLAVAGIRSDNIGRVWQVEKTQEYMFFQFSADSSGTYLSHTAYPVVTAVRVWQNLDEVVPAGHCTNCVDLFVRRS
jgi:hypothetical protein